MFSKFSSVKKPLKHFFIITGNPNYEKIYWPGNVDGLERNSSVVTFLSRKFIGKEFLRVYKVILKTNEEFSSFFVLLNIFNIKLSNHRKLF